MEAPVPTQPSSSPVTAAAAFFASSAAVWPAAWSADLDSGRPRLKQSGVYVGQDLEVLNRHTQQITKIDNIFNTMFSVNAMLFAELWDQALLVLVLFLLLF